MGADESGIYQGGSECPYIGADLLGGGTVGPALRVRDMGPDPADTEVAGRIPTYVGPQTDGATTAEGTGLRMGLPSLDDVTDKAGLQKVETYVSCRQTTKAQYVATRTIMYLCLVAKY